MLMHIFTAYSLNRVGKYMQVRGLFSAIIFIFCSLYFLCPSVAQWQQDVRLKKAVTLWQRDLPLNEVIRKISQQIDVPLKVEERIPYLKLHLFVHQRQAWEVLDSVVKLIIADGSFKAQWVPKGKGYLLQVKRVTDLRKEWEKFLQALLNALSLLAEGKSVSISFKGMPVQLINSPESMRQHWRFFATLTSEQKERISKGQLVSLTPSTLSLAQQEILQANLLHSFPLAPSLQEAEEILVGIQTMWQCTPALLLFVQFQNGKTHSIIAPPIKNFEQTIIQSHRNKLQSIITKEEKQRVLREVISLSDWALAVGRRAKLHDDTLHALTLEEYLEWLAVTANIPIMAEGIWAMKITMPRMPASSPKTLAEGLERVADTYHMLWLRSGEFYLFYNPFRGIPTIDHTEVLMKSR